MIEKLDKYSDGLNEFENCQDKINEIIEETNFIRQDITWLMERVRDICKELDARSPQTNEEEKTMLVSSRESLLGSNPSADTRKGCGKKIARKNSYALWCGEPFKTTKGRYFLCEDCKVVNKSQQTRTLSTEQSSRNAQQLIDCKISSVEKQGKTVLKASRTSNAELESQPAFDMVNASSCGMPKEKPAFSCVNCKQDKGHEGECYYVKD